MNPAVPRWHVWLIAAALSVIALVAAAGRVHADTPPSDAIPAAGDVIDPATLDLDAPDWLDSTQSEQSQPPPTCDTIAIAGNDETRYQLVLGEQDLSARAGDPRVCLYWDARWDSYVAVLLGARTLQDFRQNKSSAAALLAGHGVHPCDIGIWLTADAAVRRQVTATDRRDAGVRCTPSVMAHGPAGDARVSEVEDSLIATLQTLEQVFGWSLTAPVRVHLYDDHAAFVQGKRVEGGDQRTPERSLAFAFGLTTTLENGMLGVLVDTSRFPRSADLRMLLAHEFTHVAQAGLLGTPDRLPFFVVEGGAEYVASLVVGVEQRDLAARYRSAVADQRAGRAVPLRELVSPPAPSDERRTAAAYSRGYAAIRYLTARWGQDAFTRLHQENIGVSPESFLRSLTSLTGLSLDEFDRAVGDALVEAGVNPG